MQSASVMVPRARSGITGRREWRIVVGALIVVAAIGYLVFSGLKETTVYYITVSELQARGAAAAGQQVRVNGKVVPGTIVRDSAANALRFTMFDEGGQMPVVYRGIVPDIFNDEAEVVVEGRYTSDGVFQASTLLAKCPSRFEEGDKLMPQQGLSSG